MTIETLDHTTAIGASPIREILPIQQRLAIDKCAELAALVDRYTDGKGNGRHATAIDALNFKRESAPAAISQAVSKPLLVIVVQGKKQVLLNEQTYQYGVAQYLVYRWICLWVGV
ncbi:MAG: hypothetical protein N4J56_007552 [Chroococcidiopsis sp. SAG 2025]|nr:hypothetical protein [Chroococcidiopsis sp. SAG 2025]